MDAGANCVSAAASYVYSVEGRRVKRAVGGATTLYLHDGGSVLSEFANPSPGVGTWQKDYIYLGGQLLATESATDGTRYHFSDHLGTPRVLTDAAGNVISRHDYYPYGKEITAWSDGETHKFTGKERDSESNLDYFIARYYSSAQGRFLSPDEFTGGPVDAFSSNDPLPPGPLPYADITNPQSLNKYAYTYNNPLRYTDPNGHCPECIDFLVGTGDAVLTNMIGGAGRQEGGSTSFQMGQMVGDALSVVGGAVEMLFGAATTGGGGLACATGPGCVVGAPAVVGGLAVGAHGTLTAGTGLSNLFKSDVQANRESGLEFESHALQGEGLPKNTTPQKAVDPKTGKEGTTIPDGMRGSGQTVEVKGGKRVSDSKQLRLQSQVSQQAGQKAQVVVKPGTKVSNTVRERMDVSEKRP